MRDTPNESTLQVSSDVVWMVDGHADDDATRSGRRRPAELLQDQSGLSCRIAVTGN